MHSNFPVTFASFTYMAVVRSHDIDLDNNPQVQLTQAEEEKSWRTGFPPNFHLAYARGSKLEARGVKARICVCNRP